MKPANISLRPDARASLVPPAVRGPHAPVERAPHQIGVGRLRLLRSGARPCVGQHVLGDRLGAASLPRKGIADGEEHTEVAYLVVQRRPVDGCPSDNPLQGLPLLTSASSHR